MSHMISPSTTESKKSTTFFYPVHKTLVAKLNQRTPAWTTLDEWELLDEDGAAAAQLEGKDVVWSPIDVEKFNQSLKEFLSGEYKNSKGNPTDKSGRRSLDDSMFQFVNMVLFDFDNTPYSQVPEYIKTHAWLMCPSASQTGAVDGDVAKMHFIHKMPSPIPANLGKAYRSKYLEEFASGSKYDKACTDIRREFYGKHPEFEDNQFYTVTGRTIPQDIHARLLRNSIDFVNSQKLDSLVGEKSTFLAKIDAHILEHTTLEHICTELFPDQEWTHKGSSPRTNDQWESTHPLDDDSDNPTSFAIYHSAIGEERIFAAWKGEPERVYSLYELVARSKKKAAGCEQPITTDISKELKGKGFIDMVKKICSDLDITEYQFDEPKASELAKTEEVIRLPLVKKTRSTKKQTDADVHAKFSQDGDGTENFWNAPTTWNNEIGNMKEVQVPLTQVNPDGSAEPVLNKKGKPVMTLKRAFEPLANFDFVIERELRELKGEGGGALVIRLLRSGKNGQQLGDRCVIGSYEQYKCSDFDKAIKRECGFSVTNNLKDCELRSLIHIRLKQYYEDGGEMYKLANCYGQQDDGTWVFKDKQFKADGTPTYEEESKWVFNESLGRDDFIPCPELAEQNSEVLQELIDISREFFGEANFHQFLMTLGWVVAGLHSQEIFKHDGCFPLLNPNGEAGGYKTVGAETALSVVGKNWSSVAMLARITISALYEHGSRTGSLPFMIDDPPRSAENEDMMKTWFNRKPRRVRGNDQKPKSPLGAITNHVMGGEQVATFTRFARITYVQTPGKTKADKELFQKLKEVQLRASGAFVELIKIGYDPKAIYTLESDLLEFLPMAHSRVAQSLAIPLYYGQKILEMTGGKEDLKDWVIKNCCSCENDSDNAANSLHDFIEKLEVLEAESKVGAWNLRKNVVNDDGKNYHAVFISDAWQLVDQRFKPATYNHKSLKPLVLKAGGFIGKTIRMNRSADQTLTYERSLINPRMDSSGVPIPPTKPETIARKCWLIPSDLFGNTDPDRNESPCGGEPGDAALVDDGWGGSVAAVADCCDSLATATPLAVASVDVPLSSSVTLLLNKEEDTYREERNESDQRGLIISPAHETSASDFSNTVTSSIEESYNPIPEGIAAVPNPQLQPQVTSNGCNSDEFRTPTKTSTKKGFSKTSTEKPATEKTITKSRYSQLESLADAVNRILDIDIAKVILEPRGYTKGTQIKESEFEACRIELEEAIRQASLAKQASLANDS